jgi:hypothetical protein
MDRCWVTLSAFRGSCLSTDRVLLGYGLCRWITAFLSKILHPSSGWKLVWCGCGYAVHEDAIESAHSDHRIRRENRARRNKRRQTRTWGKGRCLTTLGVILFVAGGTWTISKMKMETESKTLWRWLFNKNIMFLDIIHRDSSVGIATGYGLDDRGVGVRVSVRSNFSLLHVVQTGSGVHPASYPIGTKDSFPGVKRPGREADHSPPTSAEVTPHTPSWRSA